jgi:2'-5' RNA ligase
MGSREDAFYDRTQAELDQLEATVDHWYWRPGWRVGRSYYTWHLTFENTPEVAKLAAYYQRRISLPSLDAVPAEGLHMTLQGVGFTDEVSDSDVAAITDRARERCASLQPFTITLGPARADAQGVGFRIEPWAPIEQLRHELRAAIADTWSVDRVPDAADDFYPHVTIFYSNSAADPAPLRGLLADLRDTPPVTITVEAVSLIQLNRDEKVYRWGTPTSVPFGRAS